MGEPKQMNLLVLSGVSVVYMNILLALRGVSLSVPQGSMVALLGANGSGKTTTLKAISNLVSLDRGKVTNGTIRYDNSLIQGQPPEHLVQRGIVQVLEGRRCFLGLTVEENLAVASNGARRRRHVLVQGVDDIYEFFPSLARQRKKKVGILSGGEQQMVAIGRALLAQPQLLLMDEPSMGLAPQLVVQIFETMRRLNETLGLTILVAEQNAHIALKYADTGYMLSNGTVVRGGSALELSKSEDVKRFYLGTDGSDAAEKWRNANYVDWMV